MVLAALSIMSSLLVRSEITVVPDKTTAAKLAEVVAVRHYGRATIDRELPFVVQSEGETWLITGKQRSLLGKKLKEQSPSPKGVARVIAYVGGSLIARIRKADGRFLLLTHGE